MKIAFLTPEFPHKITGSSGGIGTSILNLSKGLVGLGHEISIIVYNQNRDEIFCEDSMTIYKVKNVILKGFSFYCTQKKLQKLINNLYRTKKIDIIEVPDWEGISAFISSTCPMVLKLHGSDTYFCDLENRKQKKRNRFYEKIAIKRAKNIVSVSFFTAFQTKKLIGFNQSFKVIPNAIAISQFIPKSDNDTNTILYFGTLIRKKGMLEIPLIFNELVKKNKEAKLILVGKDASDVLTGNNSVWGMMQSLFDDDAIKNVYYLGEKPYSEMKNYIEDASVCIFPTFAEAFPVSWLEAMAMQKAIVASNIGWATEMIQDSVEGFLVNPKDYLLFAEKIDILLRNFQLRQKIGMNAREKVLQKFSDVIVAKQNVEYYSNIVKINKQF